LNVTRLLSSRRWLRHTAALLLYLGLATAMFSSSLFASRQVFSGAGADPELFIWYLKYIPWSLLHGHLPFFTTWIVYPQGANLMWNGSIILPALVMAPITLVFGPVAAWNVLVVVAVATSAWAAYLVLGRFATSAVARLIGGLAYGFSAYMVNQSLGHAHLTIAWYPPVLLLLLDMILLRPHRGAGRWKLGVALGLATAAQLLSGEEVLATSAICALVLLLVVAALHPRRAVAALRSAMPALGIGAAVFAVLAAYPLKVQFFGPQRVSGLLQPVDVYVTDLANLVVPSSLQEFSTAGARHLSAYFTGGQAAEADAYLGIPLVIAVVVAIWLLRGRRLMTVVFGSSLIIGVLSLGPRLHVKANEIGPRLPWVVFDHLPVLQNILPVRLMLYVSLGIAVLLAVAIDAAVHMRPRWRGVAAAVAVLLALVPLTPVVPFPVANAAVPRYFSGDGDARKLPEGTVLMIAPYAYPFRAALWQVESGMRFRMTEGTVFVPGAVFGSEPSALRTAMAAIEGAMFMPPLDDAALAAIVAVLRNDHVDEVVVGPYDDSTSVPTPEQIAAADAADLASPVVKAGRAVALLRAVLGRPPLLQQGVYVWTGISQELGDRDGPRGIAPWSAPPPPARTDPEAGPIDAPGLG
jgi:hypothetical protein